MKKAVKYKFRPDYAVSPGEILEETLDARCIQKTDFALRTGLSQKTIYGIIAGKAPVSPETALALERVLGTPAEVWLNLQATYDAFVARKKASIRTAEEISWAKSFPLKDLEKIGMIDSSQDSVENGLRFFGVASIDAWKKIYGKRIERLTKSLGAKERLYSNLTWFRMVEIKAAEIETDPFDETKYKRCLSRFEKSDKQDPYRLIDTISNDCRQSGVALVLAPKLGRANIKGAAFWQTPSKRVIAIGVRDNNNNQSWLKFLNEALRLHRHRKKEIFIDEQEIPTRNRSASKKRNSSLTEGSATC